MPSFAYLDGGSASVIIGAIVAGLAGVAVFFRALWNRIRHPFGGGTSDDTDDVDDTGNVDITDGAGDAGSVPSVDQA